MTDRYVCPPDHKHAATGSCYTGHKCRCEPCRDRASRRARFDRIRRAKLGPQLIPALGTQRRIRALQAIGWDMKRIGEHAGMSRAAVSMIVHPDRTTCTMRTAARIARVYEELSARPGPSRQARVMSRKWPSPLAWDDIDRDEYPQRHPADPMIARWKARRDAGETHEDLAPLTIQLIEDGVSIRRLTKELGVSDATIRAVIAGRTAA